MNAAFSPKIMQLGDEKYEHLGDLEWFEGTLIALFKEARNGHLFVLHWLDVSDQFHKWLFFPVSPRSMRLYLEEKLSNEDLFWLGDPDTVKLLEMNGDLRVRSLAEIPPTELPIEFRPTSEGYFDRANCPDFGKIQTALASGFSIGFGEKVHSFQLA